MHPAVHVSINTATLHCRSWWPILILWFIWFLGRRAYIKFLLKVSYDAISSFPFSLECYKLIEHRWDPWLQRLKRYSLSKLRLCRAPLKRGTFQTLHVYVTMWKYLHNVHAKKEGVVSVTAVVLMQLCQGDAVCFLVKAKALYLVFWKSMHLGIIKITCNRTAQPRYYHNAFYGWQFCEPRRGGNSDFATTIWHFWISEFWIKRVFMLLRKFWL